MRRDLPGGPTWRWGPASAPRRRHPTTNLFSVAGNRKVLKEFRFRKTDVCEGLTFLFLCRMTLMESVDTTMLTFFFFMFFSLNSYCEGRAATFNPTDAKCAFNLN